MVPMCCFAGFLSFSSRLYFGETPLRSTVIGLSTAIIAILLGRLLRSIYHKHLDGSARSVRNVLKIALFSFMAALLHAGAIGCVSVILNRLTVSHWHFISWSIHERFYLLLIIVWPMYFCWSLGYFWVRAELKILEHQRIGARAAAEAHRMEVQLLRFQLDPHFLFNTLNGIITEIHSNPEAAVEMVTELSSYLQYSLDHRDQMITRFSSELDATDAYLRIQKARFGDRLETTIEATQPARIRNIPSFLLQPLVENAFKHGFSASSPTWKLEIKAHTEGDHLVIKVRNQGTLTHSPKIFGVGLESIVGRLEIHYPGRNSFLVEQEGDFVTATLNLEGEPCNE
jgi:hypothetical protein